MHLYTLGKNSVLKKLKSLYYQTHSQKSGMSFKQRPKNSEEREITLTLTQTQSAGICTLP